jgi:RNA-binding protein
MSNSSSKESDGVDPPHAAPAERLKGYQLNHLRALAHPLKPVILIGQKGITEAVVLSFEEALDHHELIKVKFIENKDRADKRAMIEALQGASRAQFVGMVGHIAIFYRPHPNPEKRKIVLPKRAD